MTDRQENNRIAALLDMTEGFTKVLWGKVVTRGRGLNWRVEGGGNGRWLGPVDAARYLVG